MMAIRPNYSVGTVSLDAGGTIVTGVGSLWVAADIQPGDTFKVQNLDAIILSIDSNTQITLAEPWTGTALSGDDYAIRYQPDGSRYAAAARTLIELLGNGNLTAFAALAGALNMIPMFTGAGSLVLVPRSELTQGVDYDVQVDTLADRAGYDGQAAGFTVLVSDVGDGRAAIYSKASGTLADWTDPAFLTGPSGSFQSKGNWSAAEPYNAGDVVFYQGSSWIARVDHTNHAPPTLPTTQNTWWTILVRAGSGFTFRGTYSGATAYLKDDVVIDQGSSWIALLPTTGNAPPALPTTSDANWQALAVKGQGDVSGPGSSLVGNIATFSDPTGKVIVDGGTQLSFLQNASEPNLFVNGGCQCSEELGGAASAANGAYPVDQFYVLWNTTAGIGHQRVALTPTGDNNSRYCIAVNVNTIDASVGATEYLILRSKIEGSRLVKLQWGFANAKPIILAFTFNGNAGTYSIALRNAGTRSYIKNFTVTPAQANTNTRFEFLIPGDVTGTWSIAQDTGIEFSVCFAVGSSFLRANEGWDADGLFGTPANTSGLATVSQFFIFEFDMYVNRDGATKARPFVQNTFDFDLRECQRYWHRMVAYFAGNVTSGSTYYTDYKFSVPPRAGYTTSATNQASGNFPATPGTLSPINGGVVEGRAANGTGGGVFASNIVVNGRM